jgi:hypothetical protein
VLKTFIQSRSYLVAQLFHGDVTFADLLACPANAFMVQVQSARSGLESQLATSRAEVSALTAQLAELRGSLAAARDSVVASEAAAARLQEERVRLSKVGVGVWQSLLCCGGSSLAHTARRDIGYQYRLWICSALKHDVGESADAARMQPECMQGRSGGVLIPWSAPEKRQVLLTAAAGIV